MTRKQRAMYLMKYAVRVLMEGDACAEDKRMRAFVRSLESGYLVIKITANKEKRRPL